MCLMLIFVENFPTYFLNFLKIHLCTLTIKGRGHNFFNEQALKSWTRNICYHSHISTLRAKSYGGEVENVPSYQSILDKKSLIGKGVNIVFIPLCKIFTLKLLTLTLLTKQFFFKAIGKIF